MNRVHSAILRGATEATRGWYLENKNRKIWNNNGMKRSCFSRISGKMSINFLLFAAASLAVIASLSPQFSFRGSPPLFPKLSVPISRMSVAESRIHDQTQKGIRYSNTTSEAESETVQGFKRPIWTKLAALRDEYGAGFIRDNSAGPGRGTLRNAEQVRFWIDLLASDDPELVTLATGIIEGSTWEKAGALRDSRGVDRDSYSLEEWESHQIFNTFLKARALLSGARNSIPSREAVAGGDINDSLILEDAEFILKVFVPKLRDPDPARAATAKSVINLFTFDIFRDEVPEWWEAHFHDEGIFGVNSGSQKK